MDITILEGVGLTPLEAKIFIIVLELGESKAGRIIEKSGMQSSSVYNALHGLILKGLVSYIKKSEVKYYKSADPEAILDYLELKKREYLKILPELKSKQKSVSDEGVEYFKSYKGIRTILSNLFKDSKVGDKYLTFSIEDQKEYERAREKVFRPIKQLIRNKKLDSKGIFSSKTDYSISKNPVIKKRYLNIPLPPNTLIFNDKVAIISWNNEPQGILIKSKDIADKYAAFFEAMWKIANR